MTACILYFISYRRKELILVGDEGWQQRHGAKVKLVKCEKLQISVAEGGGVSSWEGLEALTPVVTSKSPASKLVQHCTSLYVVQ